MSRTLTLSAFIVADMNRKDRSAMHAVRLSIVQSAIDAALRGNGTQYLQAMQACAQAKGSLAKAYRAGFAAVPMPSKHAYSGKLSAEVAQQIDAKAAELTAQWSAAFIGEYPLTVAELSEADKAKQDADRKAKQDAAAVARAQELGYIKPQELSAAVQADAIVALVQSGQLSGENLAHIAQAVNAAVAVDAEAARIIRAMRKPSKQVQPA